MNLITYSHVEARLFLLAAPSAMLEDIVDYYIPVPWHSCFLCTSLCSIWTAKLHLRTKQPQKKKTLFRDLVFISDTQILHCIERCTDIRFLSSLYILMYNYWFIPPTQWRRSCVHVLVKVLLKGRSVDRHDRVWEHFVVQFFAFAGEMPSTWYLAPIVFIISWKPSLSATL